MTRTSRVLTTVVLGAAAMSAGRVLAQAPSFRGGVDVVIVPAIVTRDGKPVRGLTSADFTLRDNGVAQVVQSTPVEAQPVDVTVVLDTSTSLTGDALRRFTTDVGALGAVLAPHDHVRLLTFTASVAEVASFQSPAAPMPLSTVKAGGATAFYNALAAALVAVPTSDRPQLVFVMSDGMDNRSVIDPTRLIALIGRSGAALHVAITRPPPPAPNTRWVLPPNLQTLQNATERAGGGFYEVDADASIVGIFKNAVTAFRSGYVLTYTPSDTASSRSHDIDVTTTNARDVVRARRGYVSR